MFAVAAVRPSREQSAFALISLSPCCRPRNSDHAPWDSSLHSLLRRGCLDRAYAPNIRLKRSHSRPSMAFCSAREKVTRKVVYSYTGRISIMYIPKHQ